MNSPVANTVVESKVKTPRAPTLASKYSKFMAFGYWMTSQLVEKAILSEAQRDSVFENLAMFQSLDDQVTFYDGFLKTSCGPATKAIKKLVAAKNKPAKSPRAKKTKAGEKQDDLIAKLIADANDDVTTEGTSPAPVESVPKKKAAPKKSKKNTEETVASDVTPLTEGDSAPAETTTASDVVAAVTELQPKKKAAPKKSKKTEQTAIVETAIVEPAIVEPATVETAIVEPATVEPKKKAAPKKSKKTDEATTIEEPKKKAAPKKSKKTETAVEPVEEVATVVAESAEDDDEDIIQTRVVAIAEKEYLIDSQNNLYTIQEPHDNIGSYDPASGNVSFRPSYTATADC